jgi:hypothetical protein
MSEGQLYFDTDGVSVHLAELLYFSTSVRGNCIGRLVVETMTSVKREVFRRGVHKATSNSSRKAATVIGGDEVGFLVPASPGRDLKRTEAA